MSSPPQRLARFGAAFCLVISTAIGLARAQGPETFTLSWQAPAGCPGATEVRAEILRLLGGSVGALPGKLRARAEVVTRGQSFAVVLKTESAGNVGRRSLEADSCGELAHATALIVALMIDPDAVAAHAPPPESPAPEPSATQPARALDFGAGIVVTGTQGTLPSPDVGLGGIVGVSGTFWRVDVRASYGLRGDQKASAPVPPGGQGQFSFFSALLSGCLDLGGPSMAWGPCGVGEFGVVSAKGVGVDRALPAHVPWWAVGVGAYAAIPLSMRWVIPIHLDALLPLSRSEYIFRDRQGAVSARVFKAAPLGIRASAGIELHF